MAREGRDKPVADACVQAVHEDICVNATVTVTPSVTVGTVRSTCVGGPSFTPCGGTLSADRTCSFNVSQTICVTVPLTFDASATAVVSGTVCGTPGTGPCS